MLRMLQQTASPALDVTVFEISIEYKNTKAYNANGCLNPAVTTIQSKYYANVRYSISNSGDAAFVAPAGVVGYTACGTPSILGFLDLKIEGLGTATAPYPAIELNRFAPCVIDDSSTAACSAGGPTTVFNQKPSQSMGIQQGGSYGVSKTARARFPLSAEQFNAIKNSAPATLTFTLSVNKVIAADGAAGVVAAVDGSTLKDVTWEASGQGTTKQLFLRAVTAAPSAAPTTQGTAIVCDNTM